MTSPPEGRRLTRHISVAPKSAAKPPYNNPYGGAYTNAAGPTASGPAAAPTRFCDQCGAKLDPGAAFCSSCGKRMG